MFKLFPLIEYALVNSFNRNVLPPGQKTEMLEMF